MSQKPWCEIIGFSLIGPAPIGSIHIPWSERIQVLYGANGVGKSRILEAISAFGRAQRRPSSKAFLHIRLAEAVRIDPLEEEFDQPPEQNLAEAIRLTLHAALSPPGDLGDTMRPVDSANEFYELHDLIAFALQTMPMYAPEGPAAALLRSGLVSFTSSGELWLSDLSSPEESSFSDFLAEMAKPMKRGPGILTSEINAKREFETALEISRLEWPSWAPRPVLRLFRDCWLPGSGGLIDVISPSTGSAEQQTEEILKRIISAIAEENEEGVFYPITGVLEPIIDSASTLANEVLRGALLDAPELVLVLEQASSWIEGRFVRWFAKDGVAKNRLSISALSDAQTFWTDYAIAMANRQIVRGSGGAENAMIVIDEPERALHPAAVTYLMEYLESEAAADTPVLLATHSPQVLAWPAAELLHVIRDFNGGTVTRTLRIDQEDLVATADRLGLKPIDLLQLYRVILVVEGEHDRQVLTSTLAGEWEANRILIVSMSGSDNAIDVAGSEILRDFTEARVVILLDDIGKDLSNGIASAKDLAMDGNVRQARNALLSLRPLASKPEQRKAIQIASNYLDRPQNLHIRGLPRQDIIEFLDPGRFGLSHDWDTLRQKYEAEEHAIGFKRWLRDSYAARINTESIAQAAKALRDRPPPEFTELLDYCAVVGGYPRIADD